MARNVLIVESPAKGKTIKKYLGKDFEVLASFGHVRDLVPKDGAVDPDNQFAMRYQPIERNQSHVAAIKKALKKADTLYLATDPDREGEAIAWHLHALLAEQAALTDKAVHRVTFNQITKAAVQAAIAAPRTLATDLIDAQQARRALDYLVGFNLSPLLWKKVRRGLSAGRVQSPALRLIVERELEIEAFVKREYWSLHAELIADKQAFSSQLVLYDGKKLSQFSVTQAADAKAMEAELVAQANGRLNVIQVERKQRKRQPAAPFITSTLQQEAARKLSFTARKTMQIAQQLYEGVDVGEGSVGLISYMRTDSVALAPEAVAAIRSLIAERYGQDKVPGKPRVYKTKAKNAQEAHEAIRPTHVDYLPEAIKGALTPDQYRLYDLIWKRTVASQMIHATLDTVRADLACGAEHQHVFRATGSTVRDPGFMSVYLEGQDDAKPPSDKDEKRLPLLNKGDWVEVTAMHSDQHFTEPPPRYSEASLVKALEEYGIGRPSTYASIISTLQDREYVELLNKRFHPTDVGRVVNRFLTEHFSQYVDYDFTAKLEDDLDAVARGEHQWVPLLERFWGEFKPKIDHIEANVERKDVTQEALDEACPDCGKPLSIRLGRNGRFIGCTQYPECRYTRNLDGDEESGSGAAEPEIVPDRRCPKCESNLVYKVGRYGKFIGCSGYPKCRHIESLEQPEDTGVTCPTCHKHNLVKRRSRRGTFFYACSGYPKCKYAVSNPPLAEPCPQCKWSVLTLKTTKRRGTEKVCPQKECNFTQVCAEADLPVGD